ncbi:MAG: hypothetical protein LBT02_01725 [Rickettsiales bacterium]|jgi:ribosomal protein S19E (S16A)|nr:hypothetical protein [Rickettsiales bacterium]
MYFKILFFVILQLLFAWQISDIKPTISNMEDAPSIVTIKAYSMGDEQFYFRLMGLQIQNSGDSFGRWTPLKNYDYKKLTKWFKMLDMIDNKSNYIPNMAAYYFSNTKNPNQLMYIIDYLEQFADRDPKNNWWWYYQATFIANHLYKNNDLAIKLATKLKENSGINAPLWTKQLLPIILAKHDKMDEANYIMGKILKEYEENGNIGEREIEYMKWFIRREK